MKQDTHPIISQNNYPNLLDNISDDIWFFIPDEQWFLSKTSKDILKGHESWFDSVMKINKKQTPKKKHIDISKITITPTKDFDLLQQYYDLREKQYRKKLGFEKYSGKENKYDKVGDIIVAIYEGEVIAGGRIDYSNKNELMCNDDPDNDFRYLDLLKRFDPNFKKEEIFSEICGLAVNEGLSIDFFINFITSLFNFSAERGSRYAVGIAYPELNDVYCSSLKKLGCHFKVFHDIKIVPRTANGSSKFDLKFSPIVVKRIQL